MSLARPAYLRGITRMREEEEEEENEENEENEETTAIRGRTGGGGRQAEGWSAVKGTCPPTLFPRPLWRAVSSHSTTRRQGFEEASQVEEKQGRSRGGRVVRASDCSGSPQRHHGLLEARRRRSHSTHHERLAVAPERVLEQVRQLRVPVRDEGLVPSCRSSTRTSAWSAGTGTVRGRRASRGAVVLGQGAEDVAQQGEGEVDVLGLHEGRALHLGHGDALRSRQVDQLFVIAPFVRRQRGGIGRAAGRGQTKIVLVRKEEGCCNAERVESGEGGRWLGWSGKDTNMVA